MTSEQRPLAGRIAIVTGAASGIGRATALKLAQQGATVVAADYQQRHENDTLFHQLGITQRSCDVRRVTELQTLIDNSAQEHGGLDILISNAGVVQVGQIDDITEDLWDRCLDTNLKGAFFGAKFAIPHMRKRGGGSIVHTSSNAGLLPRAHDPLYSTSKIALNGLTRALALSHSIDRIRVNAVCPGPVCDTAIMNDDLAQQADPLSVSRNIIDASPIARAEGRMISPEEVADAILYLVSDAARMVTGTLLAIDGGKSLGVPPATPPNR